MPFPTNDTLGKGGPLQRGQTQVADLYRACGPRDEDVVTLQVPVDDGRRSGVQEVEAFEDLTAPRAQHLDLHHLEALQVAAWQREEKKMKRKRDSNQEWKNNNNASHYKLTTDNCLDGRHKR